MATSGVYVFKRNGRDAYIVRGDKDGIGRMRKSYRAARYDHTARFYPTTSTLESSVPVPVAGSRPFSSIVFVPPRPGGKGLLLTNRFSGPEAKYHNIVEPSLLKTRSPTIER